MKAIFNKAKHLEVIDCIPFDYTKHTIFHQKKEMSKWKNGNVRVVQIKKKTSISRNLGLN
jgi:hypothetical protein